MQPYLEGNKLIADRHFGGKPLFSEEYGGRPVWVLDEDRIAEYRAIFAKAIEDYRRTEKRFAQEGELAHGLSAAIRRALSAVKRRMTG